MSISIKKYVNIESQLAGNTSVPERELIGRLFSTAHIIATNAILEFESADAVGDYFGYDTDEYKRAAFYFGWVSKLELAFIRQKS